jgi:LEA14-like dessication related protein
MLHRTAVAAAALAVTLTGCALFMRSVEKPNVEVRDVALSQVSLMAGVEGHVALDVSNPNAVGVPLQGIDWQLSIAGAPAVRGHVDVSQTIPAHGVAPVTASLHIDAGDAVAVARRLAVGGREYGLDARIYFAMPMGTISVDVHKDGALSDVLGLR